MRPHPFERVFAPRAIAVFGAAGEDSVGARVLRNIVAGGFFKGSYCGFTGGYVPFAKTRAERLGNGDPRLSLDERYGSHNAYVAAVTAAANKNFAQGFLLQADRDALIAQAQASNVCTFGAAQRSCDPAAP